MKLLFIPNVNQISLSINEANINNGIIVKDSQDKLVGFITFYGESLDVCIVNVKGRDIRTKAQSLYNLMQQNTDLKFYQL